MPKRKIVFETFNTDRIPDCDTHTQIGFQQLIDSLNDDWVLDPIFNSKPIRLENTIVYHLIKYSEEEEIQRLQTGPKAVSIKKVPHNEADELLKQGYVLKDTYAKDVVLVKYEEKEKKKQ